MNIPTRPKITNEFEPIPEIDELIEELRISQWKYTAEYLQSSLESFTDSDYDYLGGALALSERLLHLAYDRTNSEKIQFIYGPIESEANQITEYEQLFDHFDESMLNAASDSWGPLLYDLPSYKLLNEITDRI